MQRHFGQSARRIALVLMALVAGGSAVGCSVSPQEELALGAQSHGQFEKESGGRYADPQVQAYVNQVGLSLARYAGRPDMQWQFHVLNSDQINAFAVPGGYIYITQGLLFRLQTEAQLAGVLGHECGHIAKRHSAKSIETQRYVAVATAGISVAAAQVGYSGAGDAVGTLANLGLLKYSRDHETEADYCGLQYMTQDGYNPTGIVQVMQILKAAAGSGGGGPLGDWTSTHPDPGNRVEYLTAAIQKNPQYLAATKTGKVGQAEFQAAVLSRRRTAGLPGETPVADAWLASPVLWCSVCQAQAAADVARGASWVAWGPEAKGWPAQPGTGELLRDVTP